MLPDLVHTSGAPCLWKVRYDCAEQPASGGRCRRSARRVNSLTCAYASTLCMVCSLALTASLVGSGQASSASKQTLKYLVTRPHDDRSRPEAAAVWMGCAPPGLQLFTVASCFSSRATVSVSPEPAASVSAVSPAHSSKSELKKMLKLLPH